MIAYSYAFVRRDLPPEQRIIQVGHASYLAGAKFGGVAPHTCLLEVANEQELLAIWRRLTTKNVQAVSFFEPDHDVGYTALVTEPLADEERRGIFKDYRLYREDRE